MCQVACSQDQSTFTTIAMETNKKQINHFLDDKSKLADSCAFHNEPKEPIDDSRFYSEILGS